MIRTGTERVLVRLAGMSTAIKHRGIGLAGRSKTVLPINESNMDRAIRILVGLFLLLSTTLLFGAWQWVFGAVSALLLATGVVGFSPLYRLIGVNTLDS
jgi:Protein of unknown function (DUF2892)